MVWHFIGILAFIVVYNLWRYNHEDKNEDTSNYQAQTGKKKKKKDKNDDMERNQNTKELATQVLMGIGCEPQKTEEGRILFEYQGVTFLMEAVNDCLFVNLIWPWCHSFSKFDIDEFARVRQVINEINARGTVSVFYTNSDTEEVAVHIKKNFVLVEHPDIKTYMKVILDSFFRTARTMDLEIEKAKLQEYNG